MALTLTPVHVASKDKIGTLNGNPVWEIATTGGLYVNALAKGAGFEIIGTGPHPGVAKHISSQRYPSIVWTKYKKSEDIALWEFEYILPKYQDLTSALREVHGD